MNNLPQYDNDELNAIKVIQAQTLALGEAYQVPVRWDLKILNSCIISCEILRGM